MSEPGTDTLPKIRTFAADLEMAKSHAATQNTTVDTEEENVPDVPPPPTPPKAEPDTFLDVETPTRATTDESFDETLEAGEIVRETKSNRFRLFPAIGKSLRSWAKEKTDRITERPPEQTVADPAKRKDTITAAVSSSALPKTDDYRSVVEHVQNQPKTEASETLQVVQKKDLPTPQWTSTLNQADSESPVVAKTTPITNESVIDLTTESISEDVTADTSAEESATTDTSDFNLVVETPVAAEVPENLPAAEPAPAAVPAADQTPEVTQPTAPPSGAADTVVHGFANAPSYKPARRKPAVVTETAPEKPERSNVRTPNVPPPEAVPLVKPEPLPAVPTSQTPPPKPVTAKSDSKPKYQYRATPEDTSLFNWKNILVFGTAAMAAIVLGVTITVWIYQYFSQPESFLAPEVPSAVTADQTIPVLLTERNVLATMRSALTPSGGTVVQIYPVVETERGQEPATVAEFLAAVPLRANGAFQRNITGITVIGQNQNSVGIVLEITSFETALGGMFGWEQQLVTDLGDLIGASPTSQFIDTTTENRDVRVAKRGDDSELIYTFIDRNTLLIATDRTLIGEVLNRLK